MKPPSFSPYANLTWHFAEASGAVTVAEQRLEIFLASGRVALKRFDDQLLEQARQWRSKVDGAQMRLASHKKTSPHLDDPAKFFKKNGPA